MRLATLMLLTGSLAGCGGLEVGNVDHDASDIEILTDQQADEAAAAEISEDNLEAELDELLNEIEADEASG